MIFIYVIISVLSPLTLTTGVMECNITQHDDDHHCYGRVGEPLIFYLPAYAKMYLKRKEDVILRVVNNTSLNRTATPKYMKICKFFRNGTFQCDNLTKIDSGVYQMDTYGNDGRQIKIINISLHILAPVSHPAMSQTCISPELRTVDCSAEGDDTEFSFYLDNNPLIETKAGQAKKKSSSIRLNGQLTGNLMCGVQNKVSSKQTIIFLTICKGVRFLSVTVLASALIPLLVLVGFLGTLVFMKKRSPTRIREVEDVAEIVYANVKVTQATQKMDSKGTAADNIE